MRLLRLRVFRRVSRILIPSYGAFAWSHALRSITHSSTKRLFLDASWKDKANVNGEERMARATCAFAAQCTQSSLSLTSQQWYAKALSLVFSKQQQRFHVRPLNGCSMSEASLFQRLLKDRAISLRPLTDASYNHDKAYRLIEPFSRHPRHMDLWVAVDMTCDARHGREAARQTWEICK